MNIGTALMARPIAFTVGGKEYVAIVGGGPGLADFGHPEIKIKPASNMLFVFTLN